MAGNVSSDKSALRRELEGRRRALTAEQVERWGGAVHQHLAALPVFRESRWVALYAAQPFEVPTAPLRRLLGERAVFPRVQPGARVLTFHAVGQDEALVPRGRWGLLEPTEASPAVSLGAIGLFLVPGVGFTAGGHRLGRGGGHYDATLALTPASVTAGLTFECCVVSELPQEPHDRRVDVLVTESRLLVFDPKRRG